MHRRTLLYVNDGVGGLRLVDTLILQLAPGSVRWGDYDGDGDLDIVEADEDQSGQVWTAIFRSDGAPPNASPGAPTNFSGILQGSRMILDWSAATDVETPAACLTYNLRIGTSAGGSEIMSAMARGQGSREIVALWNTQERTIWASDAQAAQYYWTVQAIDGAFAGSSFAPEQTIEPAVVHDAETGTGTRIVSIAPNPSAHVTEVTIELGTASLVRMTVHDVAGRCVRALLDEHMNPGRYPVSWDGTNDQGVRVRAGFYLCRLDAGSVTFARSILRIE